MTFQEYLKQTDPVKMPKVEIKVNDCELISLINIKNCPIKAVIFLLVNKKVIDYALMKDSNQLRTRDHFGNAKRLSCFHFTDHLPTHCKNADTQTMAINGLPEEVDIHGCKWNERTILKILSLVPQCNHISLQNVNNFQWNSDSRKYTICTETGDKIT